MKMTLADDMRHAAEIIEKANARYGYGRCWAWEPDGLRNEANHVEAEDNETSEGPWAHPDKFTHTGSWIERALNHFNRSE